jgi:hypothetical protein
MVQKGVRACKEFDEYERFVINRVVKIVRELPGYCGGDILKIILKVVRDLLLRIECLAGNFLAGNFLVGISRSETFN